MFFIRFKNSTGSHKRTKQTHFHRYSLGYNQPASSKGAPALKPCPPPPTRSPLATVPSCPASSPPQARTAAKEKEGPSSSKHSLKLFCG